MIKIISAYCQINDSNKYTKKVESDKLISFLKVLTQNMLPKNDATVLVFVFIFYSLKNLIITIQFPI
jgi:hypothetical protein